MDLLSILRVVEGLGASLTPYVGPDAAASAGWAVAFTALFWSSLFVYRKARIPTSQASLLASCTMSSVHATTCVVYAAGRLLRSFPSAMDEPSLPGDVALLRFSMAYMIVDTVCYVLIFTPSDVKFAIHHIISAIYSLGTLRTGRGGGAAAAIFLAGEVTGPLLNALTVGEIFQHKHRSLNLACKVLSGAFAIGFVSVRTIFGIPFCLAFIFGLAFRSPSVPLAWRITQAACVGLGMAGSQAWTAKLIKDLSQHKLPTGGKAAAAHARAKRAAERKRRVADKAQQPQEGSGSEEADAGTATNVRVTAAALRKRAQETKKELEDVGDVVSAVIREDVKFLPSR